MNSAKALNAILSEALYSYEFDVTTGIVERDIIGRDGTNYSKLLGLSAPYAFDDALALDLNKRMRFYADRQLRSGDAITRAKLLETYASGKSQIESIVYSAEQDHYYKLSYYLWEDESNGHVRALCVFNDLTEAYQVGLHSQLKEAERVREEALIEREIISALGKMYFAAYRIDLAANYFEELADSNGFRGLSGVYGNAQEKLNAVLPILIAEEHRLRVQLFTQLSTVPQRLIHTDCISCEYRTLDDSWHEASIISLKRDHTGNVTHALYVVRVVSDVKQKELEQQRKTEQALALAEKAKEQALRENEIISSIGKMYFAIFSIDLAEDRCEEISGDIAVHDLFGCCGKTHQCLDRLCDTLVLPEYMPQVRKFFDLTTLADRLSGTDTVEIEYHATDGRWHEARFIVKKRDQNGNVSHVLYVTRLVGKEKQLQLENEKINLQKLNHSLQEQINIIGSLSANYLGIYYVDLGTGSYQEINPTSIGHVQAIVGRTGSAAQAFREITAHFVLPDQRETVSKFTDITTLPERLRDRDNLTCRFVGKNLGWLEGYFIAAARDDHGVCTHAIWAFRSIREEKEKDEQYRKDLEAAKEAAEEASRAKTTFLLNMSHDIRTPMNAILGYEQLLRKRTTDPTMLHYEQQMEEAGKFLLSLINNVLDMARIESGHMELDLNYADSRDIIEEILDVYEEQAHKKNLCFIRNPNVEHVHIMCDRLKLQEIFTNVIGNALKYTPDGGTITLTSEELPPETEGCVTIRTTIQDTGIGMSPEYLPHIFDTFSREKNTTLGKVAGTGLGMALVKRYVELMGGSITVESELGKGTKFTIILHHPIADPAYYSDKSAQPDNGLRVSRLAGKKILIAEDNDLNAEIAAVILEDAGIAVDRAEDGIVCVDKIEHSPAGTYDMILMDIQMPNMDGYEATRLIRNLSDKAKAGIPIVAMTANAFDDDRRLAFESGMNGHIAKPIEISKLMETLTAILPDTP